MKVTKKGTLPEEESWAGTCSKCKAEMVANRTELSITHDQRDGDTATATCGYCSEPGVYFHKIKPSPFTYRNR